MGPVLVDTEEPPLGPTSSVLGASIGLARQMGGCHLAWLGLSCPLAALLAPGAYAATPAHACPSVELGTCVLFLQPQHTDPL